jgi:phosphoribosyl-AMP cyclohydrolase / phosphoribosyl-ATP pyrophosphohydrolase
MNTAFDSSTINWQKSNGLVPAIVQHWRDGRVLMLGYMNRAALSVTEQSGHVTFYSRSRQTLWTKGETSGNHLALKSLYLDCDADTLLVMAEPQGPVCHTGANTCFSDDAAPDTAFLAQLDAIIEQRMQQPPADSYTATLLAAGIPRIAQKVGEEAVETALASVAGNDAALLDEAADLFYHLLVLLRGRGLGLAALSENLHLRNRR